MWPVNSAISAEKTYEGDEPSESPSQTDQPQAPSTGTNLEAALASGANLVPANKEDTEGGWVVVNFDDDDNDSGAWGHGKTAPKPDKDDLNGVAGENDLMILGIKKIPSKGVTYRIKYDNTHVKIWKKKTKGDATQLVTSEQTVFTIPNNEKWLKLYIEGIRPHPDDTGTKITTQFKIGTNGQWTDGDSVKVRVAHPILAIFGDVNEHSATRTSLYTYCLVLAGGDKQRKRGNTFLVAGKTQEGKNVCYSITGLTGHANAAQASPVEKILKIGLALENMHIVLTGHCNYGVGIALGSGFNSFDQFFNTAGGSAASISTNLFGGGNHSQMLIDQGINQWNVTAINDRNSRALSPPVNRTMQGAGLIQSIVRYPQASGGSVPLGGNFPTNNISWSLPASNQSGNIKWHYIAHPKVDGNGTNDKHTIINTGKADVPATLRYKSLFLNQCNTYRSFAESFRHGVLLSSWGAIGNTQLPSTYVQGIIEGWTWQKTEQELEGKESNTSLHDPTNGGRKAFELTIF